MVYLAVFGMPKAELSDGCHVTLAKSSSSLFPFFFSFLSGSAKPVMGRDCAMSFLASGFLLPAVLTAQHSDIIAEHSDITLCDVRR